MSMRTWLIDRLGGVPAEEIEQRGGIEVYLEALNSNKANAIGIVTPEMSLQLSAVFACARVLAETMASVPLHWYEKRADGGRTSADNFYLAQVLQNPNAFMTGFELTELLMKHLALRGNAYCQIEYDERGRISEFWPLLPQNFISWKIEGGRRIYQYIDPTGKITPISSEILWHLRGMGDGLEGYSPIGLNRRAVSLGMSAEEFGERFFENDARPGVILEHPGKLKDEAYKNLKESWNEEHKGVSKAHRVQILEEGMKLHEVGIPPEDAQFLETRKFQVEEIARIFRIPPHMIGALEHATFSNIEHQGIEFVKFTVLPWARRIEQSIKKNLMLERERVRYYPEFTLAGLERGDITSRYQAYAVARQNGWMSANDIRQLENMNPVEGGDVYLVPLNMIPADQVGDMGSTEPAPDAPVDTARSLAGREERGMRSARSRHRMAMAQRRVILDVAERTMRRETRDVGEAAKKYLGKRDSSQFMMWIEEFYQQHADFMTRQFLPIFMAYAETVAAEAMDEVSAEMDIKDRLERFVRSYTGSFAAQQTGISLYRLKQVLQEAIQNGTDQGEAVQKELDHWQEARPAEIANSQTIRAGNAVAKMVFSVVGITILRWVTMGDSCPYCKQLNGRTVSILKDFLGPGEKIEAEGQSPLTTTTNVGHPPAHDGCDCMIIAGV